jgi:hypothetical protein
LRTTFMDNGSHVPVSAECTSGRNSTRRMANNLFLLPAEDRSPRPWEGQQSLSSCE